MPGTSWQHSQGFTLLGLAIVLVVLGLIAGGIMAGKSLIHAGELRSVMNDASTYVSAAATFKRKFKSLPGDVANATDYWGTAGDGCTVALTAPRTPTCNGDGNGQIASNSIEVFLAWQHLSDAQMVDVAYTGTPGPNGSDHAKPGLNVPSNHIPGSGFIMFYSLLTSDSVGGHVLLLSKTSSYQVSSNNPLLTTEDAANIDTKMDDGLPGYGSVRGMDAILTFTPNCATTAAATTAQYNTTNTNIELCTLLFKTGI